MLLTVRVVVVSLVACLIPAGPAFSQGGGAAATGRAERVQRRVAELIEQLAAPEYIARRSAQIELGEIGLPAFDQVLAASKSPDPEVASACGYLLSELAIEWSSPDDPPTIRAWLNDYGLRDEGARRRLVDAIEAQWDRGLGPAADALCRIARFDLSEAVSSRAVAALVDADELKVPPDRVAAIGSALRRIEDRHGAGRRSSWRWLGRFVRQPDLSAAGALARWDEVVAEAAEAAEAADGGSPRGGAGRIDPVAVAAIEWNLLRLQLASGSGGAAATVDRLVALEPERPRSAEADPTLRRAFRWLLEAGAEGAIDEVARQQGEALATKTGGYLLASVRHRQGRGAEADRLAADALVAPYAEAVPLRGGGALDGRVLLARWLREQQRLGWAHAEYRAVIAERPGLSPEAVLSRHDLSMSLQDAGRYAEAADTLDGLLAQVNANATSKRRYAKLLEPLVRYRLPSSGVQEARRHYNRALAHRAAGDEEAARRSLDDAIKSDHADADVLIAMHRSPDAGPSYRRGVRRRIRELAEVFEKRIEENPGDHVSFNQWAWLIGNTEGDYDRAVALSERSLQRAPDDPGYLDTLGRCYFSAGRLEDAVRVQRRAVEQMPHQQVMQRQLAEFEAALKSKGEE